MEGEGEIKAQVREFNKLEEIFDVFDTVLSFGPVNELKNKLKTLQTQGIDIHDIHRSHFLSKPNPQFSRFYCLLCVQLFLVGMSYNGL